MQPASSAGSLDALPVELLEQIGPYLETSDVSSLRLTSIHFSRVFLPFLANVLVLQLSSKVVMGTVAGDYGHGTYAPVPATLAPYIKVLDIHIFSDELDLSKPLLNTVKEEISGLTSLKKYSSWCGTSRITPDMLPHIRGLEEGLLSAVFEANINTLKSLRLQNSFLISGGPTFHPFPIPLTSFKTLKFHHDDDDRCIPDVKEVLAHSSTLETLAVSFFSTPPIYLQDIIPSRPLLDHLPLRSLALDGPIQWLPNFPFASMPSFTQLRRLAFLPSGNNVDEFWDLLRTTNVHLEHLNLDYEISPALTRYLMSYQGLQELQLDVADENISKAQSDSMIASLRSHASVINRLAIIMRNPIPPELEEDGLLVTTWLSPVLFSNLEYLRLDCPVSARGVDHPAFIQDILNGLERFPMLQQVFTEWSFKGDCPDSFLPDDVVRGLVGTTGGPKYWRLLLSWDDYRWSYLLGIQPGLEGKWRFAQVPRDKEFDESWGKWF